MADPGKEWRMSPMARNSCNVSAVETAPIYAKLVRKQGDVPGDVRRHAERTIEELHDALDFGRTPSAAVPGVLERTVRAARGAASRRGLALSCVPREAFRAGGCRSAVRTVVVPLVTGRRSAAPAFVPSRGAQGRQTRNGVMAPGVTARSGSARCRPWRSRRPQRRATLRWRRGGPLSAGRVGCRGRGGGADAGARDPSGGPGRRYRGRLCGGTQLGWRCNTSS